jgi:predicted MFS family arabinose efflux permease
MQRRRNRKQWLFGCLFANRLGYGMVALIPLIFIDHPAGWLVGWIILLSIPAIFFTNGFQALLAELIPEERRARVFSVRQVIFSIGVMLTSLLAGVWLDRVQFPNNYQWLYIFAFVVVLGSQYYLYRLKFPPQAVRPAPQPGTAVLERAKPVRLRGPVGKLLFNLAIYQSGLYLTMPLFSIYYIEYLKATDGWLGLNAAAGSLGVIIGYLTWERLLRRHDFGWAIRRASLITWIYPVLIALFPDLTFMLLVNLVVNAIHPGVDLSSLNLMLKMSDEENRTIYMSWFNMVINGSMFVAPLVGVWVANQWGILVAFMLSGLLRVIGGILFNLNKKTSTAS